jgi:hypothetical protein
VHDLTFLPLEVNASRLDWFACVWQPPLWPSGQSSWLLTQRSPVRFPALPDFLSISRLERGPLSLVRINEELLERKVAAPV